VYIQFEISSTSVFPQITRICS